MSDDDPALGKIVNGLGQRRMAVCGPDQDAVSLALTVTDKLLSRLDDDVVRDIGFIFVGTESSVDKSKSISSQLVSLLPAETVVRGVRIADTVHACYGGTASLLSGIEALHASYPGAACTRHGIVVTSDIAVYDDPAAVPTGGAGAVAMLLGPDAPLVIASPVAYHTADVFDFYKPHMSSEFPVVDGHMSIDCYLSCLTNCYRQWRRTKGVDEAVGVTDLADQIVCHVPFCKMATKAVAQTLLEDLAADRMQGVSDKDKERVAQSVAPGARIKAAASLFAGEIAALSSASLELPALVGNSYTGSMFFALASALRSGAAAGRVPSRLMLFSYGSGATSAWIELHYRQDAPGASTLMESIERGAAVIEATSGDREVVSWASEIDLLSKRVRFQAALADMGPGDVLEVGAGEMGRSGEWRLERVDKRWIRRYSKRT